MAAPEAKEKGEASYPYILHLESSEDEEMHAMDVVYKNEKFESEFAKLEIGIEFPSIMAAPEAKDKGEASYPYILTLEISDDEEMHAMDVVHENEKFESENGKTSSWELSRKFDEWLGGNGKINCTICLSDLPKYEQFPMNGCNHLFCRGCISTYVTTKIKDHDIPIKCPMFDCKVSLQLDSCRNIIAEEIIEKWGTLMEDSTFGLPNQDEFNSQKVDEILLRNLARHNRWKSCPRCSRYIEKTDGCRMVKCRCGCKFCYVCGRQAEECQGPYCPFEQRQFDSIIETSV